MFDAKTPTASDPGTASMCVLCNPQSGKKDARSACDGLARMFEARGLSPDMVELDPDIDLSATVREVVGKGYDTVVAAGGDGTICGVAQALKGTKTRMGILPCGTFNYFARSLGIPQDVEEAAEIIAAGHTHALRVAMLNDKVFLNNANFGLYPHILRSREEIYQFWGRSRAAAYWSAIKVLFRWPRPLEMEIIANGQPASVRTPLVFAINNAFQLNEMGLDGVDCIEDGKMVLMIAPNCGRLGMIRSALAVLTGKAERDRDFHMICGDDIELRAGGKKLLVARDGERTRMPGPFRLTLSREPLDVIVPGDFGNTVR
ncbi:diacylglycerol/lipid kinase family protein [Chachezhania sediminis]|uniref:diacylglycerol/lipid kinase family protein n=1 Tax=Chachezhania sediminis TaxID=2599291 RepID=UPI00131CD9C5|nr:diacylglycerol kinase family protein [Chachezhania sediminis]